MKDKLVHKKSLVFKGSIDMLPLSVAIIPWGILAGSFAIENGLSPLASQALSGIMFAGAAQLVAIGMLQAGVGMGAFLLTIFFITARHFLYGLALRNRVSQLGLRWRLVFGFLLTDELFALIGSKPDSEFKPWYALGAGLSFYIVWNISTLVGILAGSYMPAVNELGLEFAVAAMFIALVIPGMKDFPVFVCVLVAIFMSVLLKYWQVEGYLIIAGVVAMLTGYITERISL